MVISLRVATQFAKGKAKLKDVTNVKVFFELLKTLHAYGLLAAVEQQDGQAPQEVGEDTRLVLALWQALLPLPEEDLRQLRLSLNQDALT